MSIFKTKGIVLKINKVNGNSINQSDKYSKDLKSGDFLYTIFTKEYGKILCNKKLSKNEKNIDLGYVVNFEISTKENISIHKIRNIKIVSEFNMQNRSFKELNNYLTILQIVNEKIPNGYPVYELFNLLENLNISKDINEVKLILSKLKIISIIGELKENHSNKIVAKILKYINSNKIENILKLTGINEELKNELDIII